MVVEGCEVIAGDSEDNCCTAELDESKDDLDTLEGCSAESHDDVEVKEAGGWE